MGLHADRSSEAVKWWTDCKAGSIYRRILQRLPCCCPSHLLWWMWMDVAPRDWDSIFFSLESTHIMMTHSKPGIFLSSATSSVPLLSCSLLSQLKLGESLLKQKKSCRSILYLDPLLIIRVSPLHSAAVSSAQSITNLDTCVISYFLPDVTVVTSVPVSIYRDIFCTY